MIATYVRVLNDSLHLAIRQRSAYSVVGAATSRQELLNVAAARKPDIVLAAVNVAHENGLIRAIMRASPSTKTVALGVADDASEVLACAEAGIAGYISRDAGLEEMMRALDAAQRGEVVCSPSVVAGAFARLANLAAARRVAAPRLRLPDRQSQILALLDEGCSNKEIACRLGIELSTVKNHIHALLTRMGVRRRSQAVAQFRLKQSASPPLDVTERTQP